MDITLPARILILTAATLTGAGAPRGPEAEGPRWRALGAEEEAALQALGDAGLETHRAGTLEAVDRLTEAELAALAAAQESAAGLEEQRGGDVHLTDREVQIILWTAAVIGVIVLVA